MNGNSFREILAEYMEEENQTSAPKAPRASEYIPSTPYFEWSRPVFKSPNAKAYPKSAMKIEVQSAKTAGQASSLKATPRPATRPATPAEPRIALTSLSTVDRVLVERMIQWGAEELSQGLSLTGLKKAHRRLVKRLHPDFSGQAASDANHELFLSVQSAYETLKRALPEYIKSEACGSESASAPRSQRPNAA